MKYVQINATATAWAKSIVLGKHEELLAEGHDSYFFWGRRGGEENERCKRFATNFDNYADVLLTRIDGRPCFHSKRSTKRLLSQLEAINPDVVHLHNLLGYYINIEALFNWLANHKCNVVWTIHDCWAFTGHCTYFTCIDCSQWKTHCGRDGSCPQPETYPETFRHGMEEWNFREKKRLFTMLPPERMSLITPSQWLANLVSQSYLSKYRVEVLHNKVDKMVFKPTDCDFRERNNVEDKFVVLGVASKWTNRKGLDDFLRLSNELDDSFVVVLVGMTTKQVKQIGKINKSIIALPRTKDARELAGIYTSADVHVQPSIEETFGMTVAEAQACGTPVVVREGSACEEAAVGDNVYYAKMGFESLKEAVLRCFNDRVS